MHMGTVGVLFLNGDGGQLVQFTSFSYPRWRRLPNETVGKNPETPNGRPGANGLARDRMLAAAVSPQVKQVTLPLSKSVMGFVSTA
jgi:hypothetical protein